MADQMDPRGAATVAMSQVLALIALANALVECGAVKREALIAGLQREMDKLQSGGVQASAAIPLAAMIRSLRFDQERETPH